MRRVLMCLLAVGAVACEDNPCREPQKLDEVNERFNERSQEWIAEADPYPLQIEKVAEKRAALIPYRAKLIRGRDADTAKMIDAFVAGDVPAVHGLVNDAQKASMTYGWKLFDLGFDLHDLFTTEQRGKIAKAMSEPPDPFSTPFLANRAIDYVMFKIDADEAQKSAVQASLKRTEKQINVMLKEQHKTKVKLLDTWTAKTPDLPVARKIVQKSSDDVTAFVHGLVDESATLAQQFRPEQKTFVFDRLNRMKTCPAK